MKIHLEHKIFKIISEVAEQMSVDVYVIGGFVRDIFLKRNSKDIDIVVVGSGIKLAQKVAAKIENNTKVKVFKNFGTAMLRYKDIELEFVGARRESYSNDSRKPFVEDGTLEDDQNRRDFTINALALSLHKDRFGELVDPFNGIEHLEAKLIKTPLDPNITFSDDPLRIMRAIRFATQLNFTIDEECFEAIKNNVDRLKIVSGERIADELNKIILSKKPSYGFKLLDESGILALIFPEFLKLKGVDFVENIGHKDNFQHTLKVLDKVADKSNNLWLRWAAILHDIGKPITKKYIKGIGWTFHTHEFVGSKMVYRIFKNLKLPLNEKMRYVQKLVQLHLRPIALVESHVTDSAIRRLLFDAGDDVDDLMTLCKADITSKNQKKVEKFVNNFELVKQKLIEIEEKDKLRNWQPPISGNEIMEFFHIQPCKEVGIIKNAIREAILDGNLENNYEDARNYMIAEGEKLGLLSKK